MNYCVIVYAREGIRTSYHGSEYQARETVELFKAPERVKKLGISDIVITKTLSMFDCKS